MAPPLKQLSYLNAAAILHGDESVIGRSDYSSILIPHPSVSRLHATIFHKDGKSFIRDLGSRNGTYVNGARVNEKPVLIEIGDEIRIGHIECRVESTADNALATADESPLPVSRLDSKTTVESEEGGDDREVDTTASRGELLDCGHRAVLWPPLLQRGRRVGQAEGVGAGVAGREADVLADRGAAVLRDRARVGSRTGRA